MRGSVIHSNNSNNRLLYIYLSINSTIRMLTWIKYLISAKVRNYVAF